jgi:hypothetical protein
MWSRVFKHGWWYSLLIAALAATVEHTWNPWAFAGSATPRQVAIAAAHAGFVALLTIWFLRWLIADKLERDLLAPFLTWILFVVTLIAYFSIPGLAQVIQGGRITDLAEYLALMTVLAIFIGGINMFLIIVIALVLCWASCFIVSRIRNSVNAAARPSA